MAITITGFTADATALSVAITSDTDITAAALITTDGVSTDVLDDIVEVTSTTFTLDLGGDYSDGVFVIDLTNSGADNAYKAIGNLLIGTACFVRKTVREIFDCVLFQQLEAVKQLLFSDQGDLARELYYNVQGKCTPCTDADGDEDALLEGISIWIVNEDFIVQ